MIDIHTHILPGVDDGAGSIEDTVAMLRMAHQSGTRTIVATPHLFHPAFKPRTPEEIGERFEQMKGELARLSESDELRFLGDMEILLGAEHYWGAGFLEAVSERNILTLNESRYALLEFYPMTTRRQLTQGSKMLITEGVMPILAHVERYSAVRKDPRLLRDLLDAGCLTQLNARSLEGRAWDRNRRFAHRLLEEDLITLIASDGHDCGTRSPSMTSQQLSRKYSEEQTRKWTVDSPRWVVESAST
jgi:protein-tyrosine phosphatase